MYRSISPDHTGISGRLSELVESALTFKFEGLDIDLVELARRVNDDETLESTSQIFGSANIKVGGFELPLDWRADDVEYGKQRGECQQLLELAGTLGCRFAVAKILPDTTLPFKEDFELHQKRISEVAEECGKQNLKLGLQLLSAISHRAGAATPFIHEVSTLLTLLAAVKNENLGVVLDVWDWMVGGGTLEQIRELPVEQIVKVRLSDLPNGIDFKEATESDRVFPGEGQFELGEVVKILAEKGYEGPVGTYVSPSLLEDFTRDVCLKKSQEALNRIWEDAGLSPRTSVPESESGESGESAGDEAAASDATPASDASEAGAR